MLQEIMKAIVRSTDDDINFFNIVLQKDTLASNILIIRQDCLFQTSIDLIKENGFSLKKVRSRWYPAETITDANYADDLAPRTNSTLQAESLLHNL